MQIIHNFSVPRGLKLLIANSEFCVQEVDPYRKGAYQTGLYCRIHVFIWLVLYRFLYLDLGRSHLPGAVQP